MPTGVVTVKVPFPEPLDPESDTFAESPLFVVAETVEVVEDVVPVEVEEGVVEDELDVVEPDVVLLGTGTDCDPDPEPVVVPPVPKAQL